MLIKRPPNIKASEITPESTFRQRRALLQTALALGLIPAARAQEDLVAITGDDLSGRTSPFPEDGKLTGLSTWPSKVDAEPTPIEAVTGYNNYYEFGTGKTDPASNAHTLEPHPWTVTVEGEAEKTGTFAFEDLLKGHALEERIYRFRCVEAWSMVVPWTGVPLGPVLKRFQPTSKAKYVAFRTVFRPTEMPGQQRGILDWPYVEGLRIDEAMNPLSLLAVGIYGREMPNQNGAPIRLVVPWKYGFKSIKSVVTIRFTEEEPPTTWNLSAPREYGFYSNVNPKVDHPRWSQRRERRIGDIIKRDTLMFNGYAEQVAGMYSDMDLSKNF